MNLEELIRGSGARVTWEPLPVVLADDHLPRVFQNLLDNAIKYRSDQVPEVHIRAESSGGAWTFSVHDNGIGIDMRYADRIFDVFHRLHGSEKYQGAGLGLAITKRVVERYGGKLWVESTPGQGSTFYFSLPCAASEERACMQRSLS